MSRELGNRADPPEGEQWYVASRRVVTIVTENWIVSAKDPEEAQRKLNQGDGDYADDDEEEEEEEYFGTFFDVRLEGESEGGAS